MRGIYLACGHLFVYRVDSDFFFLVPRNPCMCWQEICWVACLFSDEVEEARNWKEVGSRGNQVIPFSSHNQHEWVLYCKILLQHPE